MSYMTHTVLSRVFFFKQKKAYWMRISDWSSDVCSSDLLCANATATAATPAAPRRSTPAPAAVKWHPQGGANAARSSQTPVRSAQRPDPPAPASISAATPPATSTFRQPPDKTRAPATPADDECVAGETRARTTDRNRLVQGKSVSVRVEPGGRR